MSSERIKSNSSFNKLEKKLTNITQNKLPVFNINPVPPKDNNTINMSLNKICTSSSPPTKLKSKESINIQRKKDTNIPLSPSENDNVNLEFYKKIGSTKDNNNNNSLYISTNKQSPSPIRTFPKSSKNSNCQNNTSKTNINQIKPDTNKIGLQNINNLSQHFHNTIVNSSFYPIINDSTSKQTTKNIFSYNTSSNKTFSEMENSTLNKDPFKTNFFSSIQEKQSGNSIPKKNNFNISMKHKTKPQSPLIDRKSESKLSQYQRNIKLNMTLNSQANRNIFKSSHNFNSPQKDVSSFMTNEKIFNNVSYLNYFANFNNYENSKFGLKPNGIVSSYAANTNQGLFRNYNEDRVSIILNVIKPISRKNEQWPKCSFFAIFDGHGGNKCADFLKENLHQFIFREPCFPSDPKKAIMNGFETAEKKFSQFIFPAKNIHSSDADRSGSCAIVIIILDDVCYVANLGDSRAIYSENASNQIFLLSQDHKPNDKNEKMRIQNNGGFIYQGQLNALNKPVIINPKIPGPFRIFPGRLSVSRCFGDIEAKIPELGGNPKVLIALPDIISFKIKDDADFIVFGSDGIYDKLTNSDIVNCIWSCTNEEIFSEDINTLCGRCVDSILKNALMNQTMDNVSCIFICFENFQKVLYDKSSQGATNLLESIRNRISSIDNYSIKLKEDEDCNESVFKKTKYASQNKVIKGNLELKEEIYDDLNDLIFSSKSNNVENKNNLKVYKRFTNESSETFSFNPKMKNNASNLNEYKKKRFSDGQVNIRPSNDGSYPNSNNFTNVSINEFKRVVSTSSAKKLNNSISKSQIKKGFKKSFH